MKKITNWLIAIVAVSSMSLNGCKKDPKSEPDQPNPTGKTYLPTKLTINGDDVFAYKYLDNTTLIKETENRYQSDIYRSVITYNANNQPVKMENFENGVLDETNQYTLNAAGDVTRIVHAYIENGMPKNGGHTELTYNVNHQVISIKYFDEEGDIEDEERFEYSADGNIVRYTEDEEDGNLEYDTNNGAFKAVKNLHLFWVTEGETGFFFTQNNPVKITWPTEPSENQTWSYEYNADKYPVKMTSTYAGNAEDVITFEYLVK